MPSPTDTPTDTATGTTTGAGDTALDGFHQLTVEHVEHDTPDSVVVTFATPTEPEPWSFRHGQHLVLRRHVDGTEIRRSYSICSPAPDGPLRVSIKRVPGGAMSTWATTELRAGDTIDALPPSGHFTHELDAAAGRRYTALAAGSGITPILSIVATVLRDEPDSTVRLLYVNRTSASTMLLEALEDLRDRHLGRLEIAYLFTREQPEAELLGGRPDRARFDMLIEAGLFPADIDQVFLCGPIDLVSLAQEALTAAGTDPGCIHRELFSAEQLGSIRSDAPQLVDDTVPIVASGTATLHGRDTAFDVYEGDSVLDAVQRVRPDTPFSCRSGVCSTCQARLVEGDVDMAVNYGLEPRDVERGMVLTCQSRPTTTRVVVDYDG